MQVQGFFVRGGFGSVGKPDTFGRDRRSGLCRDLRSVAPTKDQRVTNFHHESISQPGWLLSKTQTRF